MYKEQIEINKNPIAAIAYEFLPETINQGVTFLRESRKLQKHRTRPAKLFNDMSLLIDRLDHKIPPNAFEKHVGEGTVPDLVKIINASWLHRVSIPVPSAQDNDLNYEDLLKKRRLASRLTLKAIELAS